MGMRQISLSVLAILGAAGGCAIKGGFGIGDPAPAPASRPAPERAPTAASPRRAGDPAERDAAEGDPAAPAAAPAGDGRLRAWISPAETRIENGKLVTSVWAVDGEIGQMVEVFLSGQGAPRTAIASGQIAAFGTRIREHICHPCGEIATTSLKPGRYTVSARSGGTTLAEHTFDLIALPAAGGRTSLEVDPASRDRRPVLSRAGFALWVPVDARRRARLAAVGWFHEGRLLEVQTEIVDGPNLADDGESLRMVQLETKWVYPFKWDDASKDETGRYDIVVFLDDEYYGAWQVSKSRRGDDAYTTDGIGFVRDHISQQYGPLVAAIEPPAELRDAVAAKARETLEMWATSPGMWDRVFSGYAEPVVCAALDDAEAERAVRSLREIGMEVLGAADAYQGAGDVLRSRHATAAERANARRTRQAAVGGTAGASRVSAQVAKKLGKIAARYKPGCLRAAVGKELAPLIL